MTATDPTPDPAAIPQAAPCTPYGSASAVAHAIVAPEAAVPTTSDARPRFSAKSSKVNETPAAFKTCTAAMGHTRLVKGENELPNRCTRSHGPTNAMTTMYVSPNPTATAQMRKARRSAWRCETAAARESAGSAGRTRAAATSENGENNASAERSPPRPFVPRITARSKTVEYVS